MFKANVKVGLMIWIFSIFLSILSVFIGITFLTFIVLSYLSFKWFMLEKHIEEEKQRWQL